MSNLIKLTVKPHVETYIKVMFNCSPLVLSDNNQITLLLKHIFEPFCKSDPHRIRPSRKYSLGGEIEIYVSDGLLKKYGGYISDGNIKSFSDAVDLMIKQNMYSWCHAHNKPDDYVDYNIKRFIDFFEFSEDDLTFDNLKRWYYRERERLSKRKKELKPIELSFSLLLSDQDHTKDSAQIAMF
ncbi:MAG TPA: hypothetical protein DF610_12715 [Sphingobacterium sp.]|nr:hypothetical protein [Sphingobacterium sp.]